MRQATIFGYAVYLLLGWTSVLIPSLIVSIEYAFGRSDADIGVVYLLGAALYAVGALGGGFLAELLGGRAMLTAALLVLVVGLSVQGGTNSWAIFVAAAALGQLGSGAADAGVGAVFLQIFPNRRGGALNLLHLFYGAGALLAPLAVSVIIATDVDWRPIFIASAVTMAALVVAVRFLPAGVSRTLLKPDAAEDNRNMSGPERSLKPFIWLAVSIGCYEAATIGVANWLVRFMSDRPSEMATIALSVFWGGVCGVRLVAPWFTQRYSSLSLAVSCIAISSLALACALLVPWLVVAIVLFGLTGIFVGPIYPLIIAIGGDLYPRRLATLSGGLTTAATVGAIIYPPMIGFVAESLGIRAGLLGAAALGLPAALALLTASRLESGPVRAGN